MFHSRGMYVSGCYKVKYLGKITSSPSGALYVRHNWNTILIPCYMFLRVKIWYKFGYAMGPMCCKTLKSLLITVNIANEQNISGILFVFVNVKMFTRSIFNLLR